MFFLVLRNNCKRNGGHGQTNGSVNGAGEGDGDGDTGSSQIIAMTPTLTLKTEIKMHF